jgi:outer membrane protein X
MKKTIVIMLSMLIILATSAQEKGKIRVGLNAAMAIPQSGIGFAGDWDIRYNISNRMNAGIMFNSSLQAKDIKYSGGLMTQFTFNGSTGYLAHGDYYFNKPGSIFASFVGGGIGMIEVGNIQMSSFQDNEGISGFAVSAEKKTQGLLRAGFEVGHFRVVLNYHIIPRSTLYDLLDFSIGSTQNNFLGLSLGFYLGGGRWSKSSPKPEFNVN